MITTADIAARMRRLDELTLGLSRELRRWQGGTGDLLTLGERNGYTAAIQGGLSNVERARAVLAKALASVEGAQ
jgi:hypothetical protein